MTTTKKQTKINELILNLEQAAPRSCSKPKSEMCSKCVERLHSDRATRIQAYIGQLNSLKGESKPVPAALESAIIQVLQAS